MVKCLQCGEEILTQKEFMEENCDYAFIEGSSHSLPFSEFNKLLRSV